MKNETVIFSASDAHIANLYRILFVISIIILIINFNINPPAFTILLLLLIIMLLLTITKSIVIKNEYFEIKNIRLLSVLNNSKVLLYNDIKEIRYRTGLIYKSVMVIPFLHYFFAIDLEVVTKDSKVFNFDLEGLKLNDVKEFVRLINERVSKNDFSGAAKKRE